ncbi:hypothetical protein KFK09_016633 [Dendrobium nobile]|uniref:Uncharacterized protein n=1 Tax=Dendrobium nobile TaxID=94219 RepID=A0A8T3B0I9_DENNO|nr:hypothetical protein KFK09_016633 [Dendrobium nobile]
MLVLSSSQSASGRNPTPFPDHSLSAQTTPTPAAAEVKRCLRCGVLYRDEDNSSTACAFRGHTTGILLITSTKCKQITAKSDFVFYL